MKQTQSSWRDFDGAGKLVMKKSSVIDCLANFSVGERTLKGDMKVKLIFLQQ